MSLPLRKRTVHFYEIQLQVSTLAAVGRPSTATLPSLLKSFAALATARKLPVLVGGTSKVRTTLVDWHYDDAGDYFELLMNRADVGVSDVALRDFDTSDLRTAGKKKKEGIEVSAHLIVRPNRDNQTALLMLTMGAGVGPGHVVRLFRNMAKLASRDAKNRSLFYFDDPSGAKDVHGKAHQYKVRYGFAAHGHQGQTLKQALRTGEFESMELIAYEQAKFDSGGAFQTHERTLKIEAVTPKAVTAASVINAVKGYFKNPDADSFDRLRVRYKTPSGKSSSTTLEINDLDASFTLKENVELDVEIQEQQAALDPTILKAMLPLLALAPL